MLMPRTFPNGWTLCYIHRQNSGVILVSPELARFIPEKEGMLGYHPVIELDFIISVFVLLLLDKEYTQSIKIRKHK